MRQFRCDFLNADARAFEKLAAPVAQLDLLADCPPAIRTHDSINAAIKWIKSLTSDPEVGQIYEGKVVKVMEFGAFVNFFGAKDGLVHVSQLARERVEKPGDVVKEGDTVKVKLLGFDDRGKVRLSMKVVDQTTGKEIPQEHGAKAEAGE